MEIETYKNEDFGRVKAFFSTNDENDNLTIHLGNGVVVNETGFQFYIDDYVAAQIDKCELYMEGFRPKLRVKEGETLEVPTKTVKQLREEELRRELYELENAE